MSDELKNFEVCYQGQTDTVKAPNSIEAWAIFCQRFKGSAPSPKLGTVNGKKVGFEVDEEKAAAAAAAE